MTLDEAIRHAEEVADTLEDNASRYDINDPFESYLACQDGECAEEHRQLAEWLKELKAYRDARTEINQALYDDARGEQNDYERGRKSGIFLCESIISVKLGGGQRMKNETARREIESLDYYLQNHTNDYSEESHTAMMMAIDALSRSEIPNTCDDAISRKHLLEEIAMLKKSPWFNENTYGSKVIRKEAVEIVEDVCIKREPSVTPQQRAGRWIPVSERLPEKGGNYLVTLKATFTDYVYINVIGYALNLHDVDEYDFADKKRPGWYEYDNEWGHYEIDDVVAWMPLPLPWKGE